MRNNHFNEKVMTVMKFPQKRVGRKKEALGQSFEKTYLAHTIHLRIKSALYLEKEDPGTQ